jgi:methionine-rich copper-binding protein CopC
VEVYEFAGQIIGASAPDSSGPGPALEDSPPAKTETFDAPAGTIDLEFTAAWPEGTGTMRIEVTGPDGQVVYNSHTWKQVGAGGLTVFVTSMNEHATQGLGPGTYTVLYYVAGAMDVDFSVVATQ